MSAESPIRTRSVGKVVLPQQVTDPSILDGVAGFINDFVPAAYNVPNTDTKDQIQWARFEQCELDEFSNVVDCDKLQPAPIILSLGYTTGIQIWAVPASGEAKELLSWRHGSARVLAILPKPEQIGSNNLDIYSNKRPLIALCDNVAPGSDFCSLSFISLKSGEQVKLIKFKNPILDVSANKRSVVVTFSEKIAVFDAFTLEDRLTVTTCYLSPGIYSNPIALGSRWLAYAENKLIPPRRSSGGNDGEGVQSYTATVLHAAKSLGRGLMELGETVASSLTGNPQHKPGQSTSNHLPAQIETAQKGIITILDIERSQQEVSDQSNEIDPIIAHFAAHKEAVVCLKFDPSGLLLLTADKRGHDFHLFRIHPHPGGPALAAVHHLYILHRGDTTAKVQDMCFSPDSRWVTVSTLRGTTHVFPVTPYGGNVGVRTHATPHVVNKMSRFHRSAGLTSEGRSNSPVSMFEAPVHSNQPYHNPRLPPFPHPTVVQPLAQIRQPVFLPNITSQPRPPLGRQRSGSSLDESSQVALRVCACFALPRAWIDNVNQSREPAITKPQVKSVESLFIMSLHGSLIQYDLDPKSSTAVPKEKVCDDTLIELIVTAKAQWILQRGPGGKDIQPPLSMENLSLICKEDSPRKDSKPNHTDDKWLSQVEIVTHAGPHRRLWMGPQFTFKTYNSGTGSAINILDTQVVEVSRSKPVNMPLNAAYPILIEAGSVSSCEPSPKLLDNLHRNFEDGGGAGELQLREDLAEAMLESPGIRETGGHCVIVSMKPQNVGVAKVVNPLGMVVTIHSDDESELDPPPEEIIHENCDEALFRPVVASKAVIFAEPKNVQPTIATNVLHHNKTVSGDSEAVKKSVCPSNNKSNQQKKDDFKVSPKPDVKFVEEKPKSRKKLTSANTKKSKVIEVVKPEEEVPQSFADIISFDNLSLDDATLPIKAVHSENEEATVELLHDSFFDASEACHDIEILSHPQSRATEFEMEDLELPPMTMKVDVFDSDLDEKKSSNAKNAKEKDVSSSEDTGEEKQFNKKPRKPKSKLGVRIAKLVDNVDPTPVPAVVGQRSWSSVAKSDPILDLPELGTVDDFTINFPPMNYSKVLKNCIDQQEHVKCEPVKIPWNDDFNSDDALKVNEKLFEDNSSNSQTETTESDDSSKIPPVIIMDTEEDPHIETKPKNTSNKSKKSKKKKR